MVVVAVAVGGDDGHAYMMREEYIDDGNSRARASLGEGGASCRNSSSSSAIVGQAPALSRNQLACLVFSPRREKRERRRAEAEFSAPINRSMLLMLLATTLLSVSLVWSVVSLSRVDQSPSGRRFVYIKISIYILTLMHH
jgi:hypothetical protein